MTRRVRIFVNEKGNMVMDIEGGKGNNGEYDSIIEHGKHTYYLVGCTPKVYLYQEYKPDKSLPVIIPTN